MNTKVTPEISAFILENYLTMSAREIARHFGFSREVCKNFYSKNNLIVPNYVIEGFRKKSLSDRTTFTNEEDQFIKDNYLTMPVKVIGHHLKRSYCGITGRLKKLNLIIPEEIIQQRKDDSVFKPGIIPFNKGKKLTDFMSPEAIEKSKMHRFKKGNIPKNALVDGTEVIREDKRSGRIYTLIKVPGISKLVHKNIYLWELHNKRKLPVKHNIVFIDGNTQNFEISNLECISHEELLKRNTIHRLPEELKEIIYIKGSIRRQINKNSKNARRTKK
ncbi:HNH endonuclease [Flavobacterium oncorhynchi]|uniref:HNH endonuclease n=1 Tax=Flavobacterium oncorhynchi TaxID=728056 RepID=UPI003519DE21